MKGRGGKKSLVLPGSHRICALNMVSSIFRLLFTSTSSFISCHFIFFSRDSQLSPYSRLSLVLSCLQFEKHPEESMRLNVDATRQLARAAKRAGAWLLYISTGVDGRLIDLDD